MHYKRLPYALHLSRNIKDGIKNAVMPGNLFEDIGLNYIGPIDGHNIPLLVKNLKRMLEKNEPYIMHHDNQKGRRF